METHIKNHSMQNKHYLVVGGTSGIGLAIVKQLSAAGAAVFVISRNDRNLEGIPGITHISGDVTQDDFKPEGLPDKLDGLVYCPGSINLKSFRSLKSPQFQADLDVNLLGAVRVLHATQNLLKKGENPGVILFSTVAVNQGMPFHASIAAAKGAVEGLTRSLAAEWAPKIRVNCIAPSLTQTPLAEKLLTSPEKIEASAKRHPLNKVGEPKELAALATFLLSENAAWISGQVIGADGGLSTLRV